MDSAALVILGIIFVAKMTFDAKMIFENHLHRIYRAAAKFLGIMRKSWLGFHDWSLLPKSFFSIVLLVLEYCSISSVLLSCRFTP